MASNCDPVTGVCSYECWDSTPTAQAVHNTLNLSVPPRKPAAPPAPPAAPAAAAAPPMKSWGGSLQALWKPQSSHLKYFYGDNCKVCTKIKPELDCLSALLEYVVLFMSCSVTQVADPAVSL